MRRYFCSKFSTVLDSDKSGEVQICGLLLQDLITEVMEGELVAVNSKVCRLEGRADIIVDKSESKPPTM